MKNISSLFALIIIWTSSFAAPLNGPYTINSALPTGGTNFQSFNSLADSMNLNGISGNVMITVTPGSGPYNERVTFENVQGTSAAATVVIDGSNETITALTDSANRAIFRLRNVQYFTVTNLHVVRDVASLSGFYGIHIMESGQNITISNCVVDMSGSTSTLIGGIIASGSLTSILEEGDFHNITFENDTCFGGGYGASVYGLPSLATGIAILNNTFYDFHSNGIYIRETDSIVIAGNYLDKRTSNVTSVNAIQIAQNANINSNIYNNTIKVSQTSNGTQIFRGIYLFNGTGHRVYNNVISEVNLTSGDFAAIEVRTASTFPEINFNTISIDNQNATSGELVGIKESLSNSGARLLNNIISITQPSTGLITAIYLGTNSTITTSVVSDYNDIWVPMGAVAYKSSTTTPVFYNTLASWQTASGQDMNSFSVDPLFNSVSNPVPGSTIIDNMGMTVSYISTDITGSVRSIPPDMGAYEFVVTGVDNLDDNSGVTLFPNPAQTYLQFNLSGQEERVTVYNETGQIHFSKIYLNQSGVERIEVESLPSGIYFLTIKRNGIILRSRFVKI